MGNKRCSVEYVINAGYLYLKVNILGRLPEFHKDDEYCVRHISHRLSQGRLPNKKKLGQEGEEIYHEFNTNDNYQRICNEHLVSPSRTSPCLDRHRLDLRFIHYPRKCLSLHHNLSRSLPMPTHAFCIPHRKSFSCRFFHGNHQLPTRRRADLQVLWSGKPSNS